MGKRTAGADPISYCPDGKSRSLIESLPGLVRGWEGAPLCVATWESLDSRGRSCDCTSRSRFQMSSALGAGVPSAAS